MSSTDKVRVAVRVRPFNKRGKTEHLQTLNCIMVK
jgi:hypothetical protein